MQSVKQLSDEFEVILCIVRVGKRHVVAAAGEHFNDLRLQSRAFTTTTIISDLDHLLPLLD